MCEGCIGEGWCVGVYGDEEGWCVRGALERVGV